MLANLLTRSLPLSGIGANETTGLSIYDWGRLFNPGAQVTFGGNRYQAYRTNGGSGSDYYASNPVVFSLAALRILLFSEARFQFQQLRNGKPGDLFGNADLQLLEEPWAGHTTRDLLAQSELDVAQSGNSYWVHDGDFLLRLDASKLTIVTEVATDRLLSGQMVGERLAGYVYKPDNDPAHWTRYLPHEVAHYKPYPDMQNRFLGMSWLSPCLPDVQTDQIITAHKQSVIQNGASLSTVVSFDPTVKQEQFEFFVDRFRSQHEGPENASKTLFLGGGADVKTVGQTFENLALQASQGAGEVRMASCAGVPPALVGFSEGLKGSTLNAGNYGQARRRLADGTLRPLWGNFAGAVSSLVKVPSGARLWYDDAGIPFLREDLSDQATILSTNAATVQVLINAGWEPEAAIEAVQTGDLHRLSGHHTGLYSVQLQPRTNGEIGQAAPTPPTS